MSKRKRQRRSVDESPAAPRAAAQNVVATKPPARAGWRRIPTWGWVLIFVLPLALSEFMFYQSGRGLNMVLFPIVWAGFWGAILYRTRTA